MRQYNKRFISRSIGCFSLFMSLFFIGKIENEELDKFENIIFVLYVLVFLTFLYEVYVYIKSLQSDKRY
jgi:hypothetical protein